MKHNGVSDYLILAGFLAFIMGIGALGAYFEGWHPIFIVLFALGLPVIIALRALVETVGQGWSQKPGEMAVAGVLSRFWESSAVRTASIFLGVVCVSAIVILLVLALDKDSGSGSSEWRSTACEWARQSGSQTAIQAWCGDSGSSGSELPFSECEWARRSGIQVAIEALCGD